MSPARRWSPDPVHVAVDLALFTVADGRLRVLLHRRPYEPEADRWAVPGSFTRPGESLDDTARRAVHDKAGLDEVWLEQLQTYDQATAPGATRVVSVVQLALVDAARATPAGEADWWPADDLPLPLAFGHDRFVADGVARLRAKARYAPLAFQLLGEDFTLAELQVVYEAVLGHDLDVRNFRRDVLASGTVEETGDVRREGPGRPAKLYRHTPGQFAVAGDERRTARLIARQSGPGTPTRAEYLPRHGPHRQHRHHRAPPAAHARDAPGVGRRPGHSRRRGHRRGLRAG